MELASSFHFRENGDKIATNRIVKSYPFPRHVSFETSKSYCRKPHLIITNNRGDFCVRLYVLYKYLIKAHGRTGGRKKTCETTRIAYNSQGKLTERVVFFYLRACFKASYFNSANRIMRTRRSPYKTFTCWIYCP